MGLAPFTQCACVWARQIRDILAGDKQLADELLYDLKQDERARAAAAAAAATAAQPAARLPGGAIHPAAAGVGACGGSGGEHPRTPAGLPAGTGSLSFHDGHEGPAHPGSRLILTFTHYSRGMHATTLELGRRKKSRLLATYGLACISLWSVHSANKQRWASAECWALGCADAPPHAAVPGVLPGTPVAAEVLSAAAAAAARERHAAGGSPAAVAPHCAGVTNY